MTQWRPWLFQRTRDMALLWKVGAAIVGGAVLLAAVIQSLRQHHAEEEDGSTLVVTFEDTRYSTTSQYRKLASAGRPQPAELAEWIRGLEEIMGKKSPPWTFDAREMRLGEMDLRVLLERHLPDLEQRELFDQFMRGWLFAPGTEREEAGRRVHEKAMKKPPLRFASELEGDLLLRDHKRPEALAAYLRETGFEDAARARQVAFSTALALGDRAALRLLCADARCMREAGAVQIYKAAKLLNDRWLIVRSVALIQWRRWSQSLAVPLALFSASVWYLILVYSASRERLRWLRYLSPVFAGVISVWLLEWAHGALNYSQPGDGEGSPVHEMLQYVIHVGVPEETAKLCLFAVFVPLLLRYGSPCKAALTAGCVGLGFALDENLQYYSNYGAGVAVGRLVTANFMHIAMTGLIGLWFYEMFRSRFHRAGEFVTVFAGVAAAHGLYDFAATQYAMEWGIDLAGIIILAVLARTYLHHLKPRAVQGPRPAVGSTAIFVLGLAVVVAADILFSVWEMDSMKGATTVLKATLAIIPVSVLFVREFRET